ncbi:MAG: hypothetical protein NTW19_23285 [Planctomycetota bacterium]|nr:hypothetical protein [Planctomycetota bacterium]
MKNVLIVVCLICLGGCQGAREAILCRVVDVDHFQPVCDAKVWLQPWAPIHPFWPAGDKGVTNAEGEVTLSLPKDFWWYFSFARADGYSQVKHPERLAEARGADWILYMKRDAPEK